jgi:hypothetical protein
VTCALALTATGCGSSKKTAENDPPAFVVQEVGPDGAAVNLPGGASVVIPPGALAVQTQITITERVQASPPGTTDVGPGYQFGPDLAFAVPVTITLPWDRSRKLAEDPDAAVIVFRDGVPWPAEEVDATHVAVSTPHFSTYQAALFSVRGCRPFQTLVFPPDMPTWESRSSAPGAGPQGVTRAVVCKGFHSTISAGGLPPDLKCDCMENEQPTGKGYQTWAHYGPHEAWIYINVCGWSCQAECGGQPVADGNVCCSDNTQGASCCGSTALAAGNQCCSDGTQGAQCCGTGTAGTPNCAGKIMTGVATGQGTFTLTANGTTVTGSRSVTHLLTQAGSTVTDQFTNSDGATGTCTGPIIGNTISFSCHGVVDGCSFGGTLTSVVDLEVGSSSYSYEFATRGDCAGAVERGEGTAGPPR